MDFSRVQREKSIIAPSVKKYRVYTPIGGWKRGIIHRTEKKYFLYSRIPDLKICTSFFDVQFFCLYFVHGLCTFRFHPLCFVFCVHSVFTQWDRHEV